MKRKKYIIIISVLLFVSCDISKEELRDKARLAYADSNYMEANDYAKQFIESNPDDLEILGLYSRSLMETNEYAEAARVLSHLIVIIADSFLLCYRGSCYIGMQNFEMAYKDFNATIKLDGSLRCGRYGMAESCTGLGYYSQAIDNLKELLQIDSLDDEAWNLMGMNYRYLGQHELAEENYRNSIFIHPGYWKPYYNLSTLDAMRGEYDSALIHNRIALKLYNGHSNMLFRERGKIFFLQGELDSACFWWGNSRGGDNEAEELFVNYCLYYPDEAASMITSE